jgi:hypothetical protein
LCSTYKTIGGGTKPPPISNELEEWDQIFVRDPPLWHNIPRHPISLLYKRFYAPIQSPASLNELSKQGGGTPISDLDYRTGLYLSAGLSGFAGSKRTYQTPRSMGAHAQAPAPNSESAFPTRRASFDYLDSQLPSSDRVRCNVNLILKEASCP